MPPRNVNALPGSNYVAGITPNAHRTPNQQSGVQSLVSQTTPGFLQRGQSYGFGAGMGQHQSSTTTLQQQSSSHQQQQTNGTSSTLPPHLQTPNIGSAPSPSNANEVGLDPNDFPALGSTPSNSATATNGTAANATSYASQAGTGVQLGGNATNGTSQQRDFTPDDFPALGGASSQAQNSQNPSNQEGQSHPPGLNGFQHADHRTLLGALGGSIQPGTSGILNLGQSRNVHPGFQQGQADSEKQRVRFFFFPTYFNTHVTLLWS
jgi:CCR4-NOT transcription complex subunit 2